MREIDQFDGRQFRRTGLPGPVREVQDDVKERVLGHLANCLQVVNHVEGMQQNGIPAQQNGLNANGIPNGLAAANGLAISSNGLQNLQGSLPSSLQSSLQHQQTPMKPLHVHIPQQASLQPAPAVIMHPQVVSMSQHQLTAFTTPSSARNVHTTGSPVYTSTASSHHSDKMSNVPVTAHSHSHPHHQIAGAFKIVQNSNTGAPVALYLGNNGHQQTTVEPVYSVHSQDMRIPPQAPLTPPSSLDASYASSASPASSITSSSPSLSPPMKMDYAPLPVDLRQSHKVKAEVQGHMQYGSVAMVDEKLWRPW